MAKKNITRNITLDYDSDQAFLAKLAVLAMEKGRKISFSAAVRAVREECEALKVENAALKAELAACRAKKGAR